MSAKRAMFFPPIERPGRDRVVYVTQRANPVAITREEGGEWLPFPANRGGKIHAIEFDDGSIFDAYNGWRK
jgi:hypothetical protein